MQLKPHHRNDQSLAALAEVPDELAENFAKAAVDLANDALARGADAGTVAALMLSAIAGLMSPALKAEVDASAEADEVT